MQPADRRRHLRRRRRRRCHHRTTTMTVATCIRSAVRADRIRLVANVAAHASAAAFAAHATVDAAALTCFARARATFGRRRRRRSNFL